MHREAPRARGDYQRKAQKQARRVSQGQQRRTVFQVPQPFCGKFVNARVVLENEGGTGETGFFINHKGEPRHFGAKCAAYSCKYKLCVVEELAGKEAFCVARELIEMPARVVGSKRKASTP